MKVIFENSDYLKFLLIALVFFLAMQLAYFYLLLNTSFYISYLELLATWSGQLLSMAGEDVVVLGVAMQSVVGEQVKVVRVVEGCDALLLFSTLVAVILAFPATVFKRMLGLVLGLGFMYVLNLFRIAGMLWIEIHHAELFDLFHHFLFSIILWLSILLIFFIWGMWVMKSERLNDSLKV